MNNADEKPGFIPTVEDAGCAEAHIWTRSKDCVTLFYGECSR